MKNMEWITSDGGPLICVENRLKHLWGGIGRLTIDTQSNAGNDYDRACQCRFLLNSVPIQDGNALIFGDEPFSTSFWQIENGALCIVRINWTEPMTYIPDLLSPITSSKLNNFERSVEFSFFSNELILFDSVEDGFDNFNSVSHAISPGRYAISTSIYEPDSLHSFYIHELVKLSGV